MLSVDVVRLKQECTYIVLKSHARAYRLYEREFKQWQNGEVGIVIDSEFYQPDDPFNPTHTEAAERALRFKVLDSF